MDWFPLLNDSGAQVGSLLAHLNFEERDRDSRELSMRSTFHTSNNSLDLRDEYAKRLNELELEREEVEYYKAKYKCKIEKLN
jgi:hypothetical protein